MSHEAAINGGKCLPNFTVSTYTLTIMCQPYTVGVQFSLFSCKTFLRCQLPNKAIYNS